MSRPPVRLVSQQGFALMELLVALAVISVVMLIAIPYMRNPPVSVILRSEAQRLVSALRLTRAAAMAQNQPMTFSIDSDRRVFMSPVVRPTELDRRIAIRMTIAEPLQAGVAHGGIRYFSNGQATGGQIALHMGAAAISVRVNWATGGITIDD
jgi:general secretion pathway protein H